MFFPRITEPLKSSFPKILATLIPEIDGEMLAFLYALTWWVADLGLRAATSPRPSGSSSSRQVGSLSWPCAPPYRVAIIIGVSSLTTMVVRCTPNVGAPPSCRRWIPPCVRRHLRVDRGWPQRIHARCWPHMWTGEENLAAPPPDVRGRQSAAPSSLAL
jgi:hypothetical protein